MKNLFVIVLLFAPSFSYSTSAILDSLINQDHLFTLQKQLKKNIGIVFPSFKQPTDFIQSFEGKDFKKALNLWIKSIENTAFARSSTGEALYAYLLFKNGYEVLSLLHLLENSNPSTINPIVRTLWKINVDKSHPVWRHFFFPIHTKWDKVFSEENIFYLGSKSSLRYKEDQEYIKLLLSLPLEESIDVSFIEWSFVLSLIKQKDMVSATKILSWMLKKTKVQNKKDRIHLTIGRLLANIGEKEASLQYYKKLHNVSYLWLLAQEEQAWVLFNKKNYNKAYAISSAFEYPGFKKEISSYMFFILALSQLKNCDYEGATRTLLDFKSIFSKKSKDMDNILKTSSYNNLKAGPQGDLLKRLSSFYNSKISPNELGATDLLYRLRRDYFLKHHLLLVNYMQHRKTQKRTQFKILDKEEEKIIHNLENKILQRIQVLLEAEMQDIQSVLEDFQIIETEILYRIQGFHSLSSVSRLKLGDYKGQTLESFYKPNGFLYFPFNPGEIWLDELSSYRSEPLNNCPKGQYIL